MLEPEEVDNGHAFLRDYAQTEIGALCEKYPKEKQSLEIDYLDLFKADIYNGSDIADALTTEPEEVLPDLNSFAKTYDYPIDIEIEPTVRVNGSEYERTVEELRKRDVGKYITVRGQVNQLTQVQPQIVKGVFKCKSCSSRKTVLQDTKNLSVPNEKCNACKEAAGYQLVDGETTYQDHQVIELASLPEDTAGNVADSIKVDVKNDLAGKVSAGDRIKISGILKTEKDDIETEKYPDIRREIYLDGKAIQNEQESFAEIEPERIDEIEELATEPDIYRRLVDSFAPHIQTNEEGDKQKLAVILALFGGVQKQLPTGSQIRGNINILLIGDGGTAKSQFLKTAEKLAPKSVLASGKGATAAGLTATAEQSNLTGEWTLKAGALVMANNGVACIDEFDKMDGSARKSIHEALENQEVPVTKAGINTTLPAKTAVIAAANPENGEFDRFQPLAGQVDMEQPLISRFDLIFGLVDKQDEERDEQIARTQHEVAAGGMDVEPAIEYDLLREYIAYARQIEPTYASEDVKDRLVDYYVKIRKKAEDGDEPGPRLNDSLRRVAQASARVRLSEEITMQDAERAIDFIKYTIGQVGLDEKGNVSGSQLDGGSSQASRRDRVLNYLRQNEPCSWGEVCEEVNAPSQKVEKDVQHFKNKGKVYEPSTDQLEVTE